jgi:phosphoglucomutase
MPGLDGMSKMAAIMKKLHAEPLTEVAGTKVTVQKDYLKGTSTCTECGKVTEMELKDSNVVAYDLEDGTTFIIRPSGTEPKIKVYILTSGKSKAECDAKINKYVEFAPSVKEMG